MIEQKENKVIKNRAHRARFAVAVICAIVAIGVFASLMRTQFFGFATTTAATDVAAKTERVRVAVEGMSCSGCAVGIKSMLKRTDGVISAEVSYENKEAVVEYDNERTTHEKIIEVITNLGYKASVKN